MCEENMPKCACLSYSAATITRSVQNVKNKTNCEDPKALSLCLTQMSVKIILINIKMPTVVGILIFISMISKASESLIARIVLIFSHFSY